MQRFGCFFSFFLSFLFFPCYCIQVRNFTKHFIIKQHNKGKAKFNLTRTWLPSCQIVATSEWEKNTHQKQTNKQRNKQTNKQTNSWMIINILDPRLSVSMQTCSLIEQGLLLREIETDPIWHRNVFVLNLETLDHKKITITNTIASSPYVCTVCGIDRKAYKWKTLLCYVEFGHKATSGNLIIVYYIILHCWTQ